MTCSASFLKPLGHGSQALMCSKQVAGVERVGRGGVFERRGSSLDYFFGTQFLIYKARRGNTYLEKENFLKWACLVGQILPEFFCRLCILFLKSPVEGMQENKQPSGIAMFLPTAES